MLSTSDEMPSLLASWSRIDCAPERPPRRQLMSGGAGCHVGERAAAFAVAARGVRNAPCRLDVGEARGVQRQARNGM